MPFGLSAGAIAGIATAAVSTGTAIAGAVGGSGSQSDDVAGGQAAATAAQQQGLSDYTANAQPFITTGQSALSALGNADGLNGSDGYASAVSGFEASPGYQYQLAQGLGAIDNGAASTGTLRSGNTIRAEEALGSSLANQDFNQYVQRLQSAASMGQSATSSLGSAQVSTASGIASTDTSAATAQANIDGNTAKGIGSAVTGLAGNADVKSLLSGLGSGGQSAGEKAFVAAAGT